MVMKNGSERLLAPLVTEGNDDSDRACAARPEPARHLIGPETMLGGERPDAIHCPGVDDRLARQRTRNRTGRDSRESRKVHDRPGPLRFSRLVEVGVGHDRL